MRTISAKRIPNSARVVIDTNVIVSALVFGGKPRKVIDLVADDAVELVVAEEMLTEVRRIITNKFPEFLVDLAKLEKLLEVDAIWVKLGFVAISASRDADDDKFIEAAVVGDCQYIVSGDKDLLDLRLYKNIQIINPTDFLELVGLS